MSFKDIFGLSIIVITTLLVFIFSLTARKRSNRALRVIPGFIHLKRGIGLAVEKGKRLHVSLGNASIVSANNSSALVGLSTLERIAGISSISDRPPLATSGSGDLAILSQNTLQAAYRINNAMDQYDPDRGRMAGVTPISYAAGTMPIAASEQIAAHLLVGNYGPEIALLTEAADRDSAFTLAASDSLPAQAVLFATAQEPLIGEELYAIPAYLQAGSVYHASLRAQDVLRWVLVAGLFAGALLKLVGVI